jgi:hypothetical protein
MHGRCADLHRACSPGAFGPDAVTLMFEVQADKMHGRLDESAGLAAIFLGMGGVWPSGSSPVPARRCCGWGWPISTGPRAGGEGRGRSPGHRDVAGGKGCALASGSSPVITPTPLRCWTATARPSSSSSPDAWTPGLCARDFADAERQLDQIDEAVTRYGLSARDVAILRHRSSPCPGHPSGRQPDMVCGRQGRLSECEPSRQAELPTGSRPRALNESQISRREAPEPCL